MRPRLASRLAGALGLLALAAAAAPPAGAQDRPPPNAPSDVGGPSPTGQPKTVAITATPFAVRGYRSIRFGMTPTEVRVAAAKLFGPHAAASLKPTTVEPGFTALAADGVSTVEIGSARVIFVFRDGRLRAVNLEQIVSGDATDAQRQALVDRAARVAGGLEGRSWPLFNKEIGRPIGPNDLLVFSGIDDLGSGVQVSLIGVDYSYPDKTGATRMSPKAAGPAALRILIEQDLQDRSYIRPGDFAPAGPASGLIAGFRGAAFGMSEARARAAIAKDFKIAGAGIRSLANAKEHTRVLTIALPRIDPGPCPAAVSYIFDDKDGKLIAVNVGWVYPGEANPYQRAAIMIAGERLAHYFQTLPVQPLTIQPTGATGPQSVTFYAARDRLGDTVTVEADGVDIRLKTGSGPRGAAKGPAILRVAYDAAAAGN